MNDTISDILTPAGTPQSGTILDAERSTKEGLMDVGTIKGTTPPRTAVCISGRMSMIENYDNLRQHIIDPYMADVFIDTWIPYTQNSMHVGPKSDMSDTEIRATTIFPDEVPININQFIETYKPKSISLEFFDGMPLTHQIRSVLPKSKKSYDGHESHGTKTENVMFMQYKIWRCNQIRKLYEQTNRIRYDRIIRMRFDNTFDSFPVIEPKPKVLYIPQHGDYCGGICDQMVIADSQTMDLYCDLYNDIYRYTVANIGIHPESILRKHIEVNRLAVERFKCGMKLRGKSI
jgi:hypothetical protein